MAAHVTEILAWPDSFRKFHVDLVCLLTTDRRNKDLNTTFCAGPPAVNELFSGVWRAEAGVVGFVVLVELAEKFRRRADETPDRRASPHVIVVQCRSTMRIS